MRVLAVQMPIAWERKADNFEQARAMVLASHPPEGSLIVLPEMFATGFTMNVRKLAEPHDGPTEAFLCELARETSCTILAGRIGQGENGKGVNLAVAVGRDGSCLARYAKLHPFTFSGEADHYQPGNEIVTFDCNGLTIAPLICYDLRFPEVFRAATVQEAIVLVVIANWPASRLHHWSALLRARAIENQAFVVGVNRVGSDPNVDYAGGSMILDPAGDTLAKADDRPQVLTAEINPETAQRLRSEFPVLPDIRPDLLA